MATECCWRQVGHWGHIPASLGQSEHDRGGSDVPPPAQCGLQSSWRASSGSSPARTTCSSACTTTTPWRRSSPSRHTRTTSGAAPWCRRPAAAAAARPGASSLVHVLRPAIAGARHSWFACLVGIPGTAVTDAGDAIRCLLRQHYLALLCPRPVDNVPEHALSAR